MSLNEAKRLQNGPIKLSLWEIYDMRYMFSSEVKYCILEKRYETNWNMRVSMSFVSNIADVAINFWNEQSHNKNGDGSWFRRPFATNSHIVQIYHVQFGKEFDSVQNEAT